MSTTASGVSDQWLQRSGAAGAAEAVTIAAAGTGAVAAAAGGLGGGGLGGGVLGLGRGSSKGSRLGGGDLLGVYPGGLASGPSSSLGSSEGVTMRVDSRYSLASDSSSERYASRSSSLWKIYDVEENEEDVAEFQEILGSEVHVELVPLKELARHGVPHRLRDRVWMFLLGVSKPDRSEEVSLDRKMSEDYNDFNKANAEVMRRVKGDIKRYRPDILSLREPSVRALFERTLSAYLSSHMDVEYRPYMVHLLGPLVFCIHKERDIYYCFEALMTRHQMTFAGDGMSKMLSNFITLFRNLEPVLYEAFEEEELEPSSWAVPLLQSLLSKELPLPCVLRLWDTYFATDEGFDLHPYVCLSILEMNSEQLVEMDGTEVLGFLQHLPRLDMNQIISSALNMREKVVVRNLI